MKEHPMLSAEVHNWQLIGWGDWSTITWHVFNDGLIQVSRAFIPDWDIIDRYPDIKSVVFKGISSIKGKRLERLKQLISEKQWRDPEIMSDGCDGEAWIIQAYDEDGSIITTSGPLDYIYGQIVLEEITELLPGKYKMPRYERILAEIETKMSIDEIATIIEDEEMGKIMIIGL